MKPYLLSAWLAVPVDSAEDTDSEASFDFVGAVVLSAALSAFLIALSKACTWGWTNPLTFGLVAGGILVFAAFIWIQWRIQDPLVDVHAAARTPVFMANVAALMLGFAMFINLLVTTIQLQNVSSENGFELSPNVAGLAMLPSALVSLLIAARLRTHGSRLEPAGVAGDWFSGYCGRLHAALGTKPQFAYGYRVGDGADRGYLHG